MKIYCTHFLTCFFLSVAASLYAQPWEPAFDGKLGGFFESMEVYKNELYVGGTFSETATNKLERLVKWNGKSYHSFTDELKKMGYNGHIYDMTVYKDELYIVMGVTVSHSVMRQAILKYDGSRWNVFARLDTVAGVISMVFFNDTLYMALTRDSADIDFQLVDIYRWTGNNLEALHLADSVNRRGVNTLMVHQAGLYAGGTFFHLNPDATFSNKEVTRWNKSGWESFDNGVELIVKTIIFHSDQLYASGSDYYMTTNQHPLRFVNRWNGSSWEQVGDPTMDGVFHLLTHNGEIYAFGRSIAGGGLVMKQTNAGVWIPFNLQKIEENGVEAGIVYNGYLYIRGPFTNIDGTYFGGSARLKLSDPVNYAPYAYDDSAVVIQERQHRLNVLENDAEPNGDSLAVSLLSPPLHGSATLLPDNSIEYLSDSGFYGYDSLSYIICDQASPAWCDTAMVYLSVRQRPHAFDDFYTLMNDTSAVLPVQWNDVAVTGHYLITALVTQSFWGSVTILNRDSLLFTPQKIIKGNDSLVYRICDSEDTTLCDTAVVHLMIAGSSTPNAIKDHYTIAVNAVASFDVQSNDYTPPGDQLSTAVVYPPAHGTAKVVNYNTIQYVAVKGYKGNDVMGYQICSYKKPWLCDTALIYITITGNSAPVAKDDAYSIINNTTTALDVQANDMDENGDQLTTAIIAQPLHGTAAVLNQDSIAYSSTADYSGTDELIYQLCDDQAPALCDTAIVYITIKKPTGIEGQTSSGSFTVYPNPAGDMVFIDYRGIEKTTGLEARLYDLQGRELLRKKLPDGMNKTAISLSDLAGGAYYLVLQHNDVQTLRKLLIVYR